MRPDPDCAADDTIATRLAAIQARINAATQAAARSLHSVTLVAVSKTHPQPDVLAAQQAGQTVFGENRVQEAAAKFATLPDRDGCRLHLVGTLQSNKAREAVATVDVIETLDRESLVGALQRAADQTGRLPMLLVQVNVGREPQKSGIDPDLADAFIAQCQSRFGPALRGLMCVPPAEGDPSPHFRALASCAARHGLPELSMGMSADFECAIACGATMVRIGSAIFGGRLPVAAAQA